MNTGAFLYLFVWWGINNSPWLRPGIDCFAHRAGPKVAMVCVDDTGEVSGLLMTRKGRGICELRGTQWTDGCVEMRGCDLTGRILCR